MSEELILTEVDKVSSLMTVAMEILTNPGAILLMAASLTIVAFWWYVSRYREKNDLLFNFRRVPLTLLGILFCGFFVVQWGGERPLCQDSCRLSVRDLC